MTVCMISCSFSFHHITVYMVSCLFHCVIWAPHCVMDMHCVMWLVPLCLVYFACCSIADSIISYVNLMVLCMSYLLSYARLNIWYSNSKMLYDCAIVLLMGALWFVPHASCSMWMSCHYICCSQYVSSAKRGSPLGIPFKSLREWLLVSGQGWGI